MNIDSQADGHCPRLEGHRMTAWDTYALGLRGHLFLLLSRPTLPGVGFSLHCSSKILKHGFEHRGKTNSVTLVDMRLFRPQKIRRKKTTHRVQPVYLKSTSRFGYQNLDYLGVSLMVQWLRICLAIQGTWVRSLVRELRSHMPQSY